MRLRKSFSVVLTAALFFLAASEWTRASTGPKWSGAQLADFADVIVTGRVEAMSSGWDPAVNTIYTYVTIDVSETFKGAVGDRIIIKQLGGVVDGMGLAVADQPTFAYGEQVLLYLEARPRDGSLYTAALWQGKWTLETGARGEQIAVRETPGHGNLGVIERQAVASVRAAVHAAPQRASAQIDTAPIEAPTTSIAAPFALFGFRYLHVPAVNVQAGGQPGLSGGGFSQIAVSSAAWNAAGSGTRLAGGSGSAGPRCTSQQLGDSNVSVSFMDPCGEMSNSGGTLAIGGSYFFSGGGGTSNGTSFNRAAEGFVVNNDSSTALSFLTVPGCFQDIQLHELGHVLGLDHTADSTAIMAPTINNNCVNNPNSLKPDDINGLVFIYGGTSGGTTPPGSAPANVQVIVNGLTSITVTWNAVTALQAFAPAAATSYRLDFRQTVGGPVLASVTSAATTITIPLPAGTTGTFNVTVTGLNSAGAGPPSSAVPFTIGGGPPPPGPCTAAPAPVTGLTGGVVGGVASVSWLPAAGATSYRVQAGSTQGAANLFPLTDIGATTGASAPVPAGFQAWIRVFAVNACGVSPGADVFIQ